MKQLRKKFATCFCVVCAIMLLSNQAGAFNHGVSLTLSPSASLIHTGDSLEVDVIISGLENDDLGTFDFNITYDTSVLDFDSYLLGDGLGDLDAGDAADWSRGDLGDGKINFSELSFLWNLDFQSDTFTLATLIFMGSSAGTSALSFSDVILSDGVGSSLSSAYGSGTIGVSEEAPELGTIFLIGSGLIGLARLRRKLQ